jgi:5-methylcytosine-specific restriction endonuclease McrA
MTWKKTPEDRRRDAETYGDPVYKRNRAAAKRRAGGRCEDCGHPHGRLQCDHIIPVSQGGGHQLANLAMRCVGEGSCKCHERKTAQEGGGYRSKRDAGQIDPAPRPRTNWNDDAL